MTLQGESLAEIGGYGLVVFFYVLNNAGIQNSSHTIYGNILNEKQY
jgi:hypothetical protein